MVKDHATYGEIQNENLIWVCVLDKPISSTYEVTGTNNTR